MKEKMWGRVFARDEMQRIVTRSNTRLLDVVDRDLRIADDQRWGDDAHHDALWVLSPERHDDFIDLHRAFRYVQPDYEVRDGALYLMVGNTVYEDRCEAFGKLLELAEERRRAGEPPHDISEWTAQHIVLNLICSTDLDIHRSLENRPARG
jgi:hypothetical protein